MDFAFIPVGPLAQLGMLIAENKRSRRRRYDLRFHPHRRRRLRLPVRAIVCGDDERSESLRALGAEVFVADLLDLRAVRRALQ